MCIRDSTHRAPANPAPVPGTAARWRARRHDATTLPALNDYHRDKVVKHLEARAHPESGRTTRCSAHLDRSDVILLCERTSPDDHSITWHVLLLPTDGNETKGAKTRAAELQALRTPCLYPLPGRALGPHTPCPCQSRACTGNSCTMEGQTPRCYYPACID